MTESQILAACATHGAKRVYDAAFARMDGNRAPLAAVGLSAQTIGDADAIARTAFGMLTDREVAADLADVAIKAAKL